MKKYGLLCTFVLLCTPFLWAQSAAERTIRTILAAQVSAWNKGDLRGYMKGYWENDSMLFLGKKGPTYGYTATLNNYLKSYPDTAHSGQLSSQIVQFQRLSKRYCFVIGSWHLQRSVGNVGGYYSLLFKKMKGRWYIVADHSS